MTAGDPLRGTLRLLGCALRLPVLMFLAILEPVVRFILGALALLGFSRHCSSSSTACRTFPSPSCSACR